MDMSPQERAALEAEWKKGNKWGAALQRQRLVATLASTAVFGFFLMPALLLLSLRLFVLAVVVGLPAGMLVRKKLMPKGQFGGG